MNTIINKICENVKNNPDKEVYCFLAPEENGWKEDVITYQTLWDNVTKYANELKYLKEKHGSKCLRRRHR